MVPGRNLYATAYSDRGGRSGDQPLHWHLGTSSVSASSPSRRCSPPRAAIRVRRHRLRFERAHAVRLPQAFPGRIPSAKRMLGRYAERRRRRRTRSRSLGAGPWAGLAEMAHAGMKRRASFSKHVKSGESPWKNHEKESPQVRVASVLTGPCPSRGVWCAGGSTHPRRWSDPDPSTAASLPGGLRPALPKRCTLPSDQSLATGEDGAHHPPQSASLGGCEGTLLSAFSLSEIHPLGFSGAAASFTSFWRDPASRTLARCG